MAAPQSFTRKQLRFSFVLDGQVFPGTLSNTLQITGLRSTVTLKQLANIYGECDAHIFGMAQSDMNEICRFTIGAIANPLYIGKVLLRVESNDGITGWFRVFEGTIVTGGPDYSAAPDVAMAIHAVTSYSVALSATEARSYPGTVSVASIVEDLASAMNRKFVAQGVTSTVTDEYLPGSLTDQLKAVTAHAQPPVWWDDDGTTITLLPLLAPSPDSVVYRISAESGMVGYPSFDNSNLTVEILFNPAVRQLARVHIESDVPFANGGWTVFQITTELSSEAPGGPWFSTLGLSRHVVGGNPV